MPPVLPALMFVASAATASAEYVAGMTCDEVRGFAEAVAVQKGLGDSLKEQVDGMRQSIAGYPDTQAALEKIIRAIYANARLGAGRPEDVGKAYEQTCQLFKGVPSDRR